jgi:hypothetical protein
MRSTRSTDSYQYIGGDLTDRYSVACRPIDVCGLAGDGSRLIASFWHWEWDPAPHQLDVTPILQEINKARSVMLDGPQGLALRGESLRSCERQAGAVGKTPDTRPSNDKPFATYIHSSLDFFLALHSSGILVSPPNHLGGVNEVYPGHIWSILAPCVLPKKSTKEGRLARKRILEAIGVLGLPGLPTHDQNDACVGALMGAAADGKTPGMTVRAIGLPLTNDRGLLREGTMIVPVIGESLRTAIAAVISDVPTLAVWNSIIRDSSSVIEERGANLLSLLIDLANHGNPQVCTYSWAYRFIFGAEYGSWSQAYAKRVIQVAEMTPATSLPGLGAVRLDAFIVSRKTGRPSGGHWESANYDPEDWDRVLGTAKVMH